jgi:plasmid maintenance system killer protein
MKKFLSLILAGIFLTACNSEPSLQRYMVDRENSSEFISASLSTDLLLQNLTNLNSEEKDSFGKIQKINVLALRSSEDPSHLEKERKELKSILTNNDYESLFNFNNGDDEARLLLLGTEDHIKELVFFGFDSKKGMLLLRMRGNDVNANDIYQITQSAQKLNMGSLPNGLEELIGGFTN